MREEFVPKLRELLDEDRIAKAVGQALQKNDARGWTRKERLLVTGMFGAAAVSAFATIASLFLR